MEAEDHALSTHTSRVIHMNTRVGGSCQTPTPILAPLALGVSKSGSEDHIHISGSEDCTRLCAPCAPIPACTQVSSGSEDCMGSEDHVLSAQVSSGSEDCMGSEDRVIHAHKGVRGLCHEPYNDGKGLEFSHICPSSSEHEETVSLAPTIPSPYYKFDIFGKKLENCPHRSRWEAGLTCWCAEHDQPRESCSVCNKQQQIQDKCEQHMQQEQQQLICDGIPNAPADMFEVFCLAFCDGS